MSFLDLALIAVYLLGITLFGLRFRKRQRSLRDYSLADRSIPW
jgi:solute:Na+ symporter, SSS family